MPAIARLTTYGRNWHRDRERLIDCLRHAMPFYMASTTGGPVDSSMNPSTGQMPTVEAFNFQHHVEFGCCDYVVWSYQTPIAYRCTVAGWIVPNVRYSRTTTQHQSIIRSALHTLEG
jgi:hypothetical protein